VTNGPPSQEAKIRAAALHDAGDAWCISEIVGAVKPERAIFEAAAALCGASLDAPVHGWMVGDNPDADILGGVRAGLRTIWMARGRQWAREGFAPDAVAADVAEAVRIILAG
jgi:putative hydrolase of the HAD superfamily